ncbi:hypothetical protein T484DRAFT_1912874, partial [Baffinella frigidus]
MRQASLRHSAPLLLALLVCCGTCWGAEIRWNCAVPGVGNFFKAENWLPETMPGPDTDVFLDPCRFTDGSIRTRTVDINAAAISTIKSLRIIAYAEFMFTVGTNQEFTIGTLQVDQNAQLYFDTGWLKLATSGQVLSGGKLELEHVVSDGSTFQTAVLELKTLVNRGTVSIPVSQQTELYFNLDNYGPFTTGAGAPVGANHVWTNHVAGATINFLAGAPIVLNVLLVNN